MFGKSLEKLPIGKSELFMRKLIAACTALFFIVFMPACTKKMEVLHVIQAPYGEIKGDKNFGYKLTIEEMKDTVIWFSSRPERKAGYMHVSDFMKSWDEGKSNFKKDPPNAVLIIGRSKPVAVELMLISYGEEKAIFKVINLQGQEHKITDKSGPVTLYIDANIVIVNPQVVD